MALDFILESYVKLEFGVIGDFMCGVLVLFILFTIFIKVFFS